MSTDRVRRHRERKKTGTRFLQFELSSELLANLEDAGALPFGAGENFSKEELVRLILTILYGLAADGNDV